MEPIRAEVELATVARRAFELLTDGMGSWWQSEFSWSEEVLDEIGIEPRVGGLAFERGPRAALEHGGWERHGEGARDYRDGFEQAGAWPYALERLAAEAAGAG
jgi:hypothetical protein